MPYKQLLVALFLVFYNSAECQRLWVKGYGGLRTGRQYDLFHTTDPDNIYIVTRRSATYLLMPAIAFENQKGNFLEIGFSWQPRKIRNKEAFIFPPSGDSLQLVDLGATKRWALGLDCGFNHKVYEGTDGRWNLFFGWLVSPFWNGLELEPHQDYIYRRESYEVGINWGFVPRAQFNWLPNLRLDINACLFPFTTYFEHSRYENPVLSGEQQKFENFALDIFGRTWIRAGLSWSFINNKKTQD